MKLEPSQLNVHVIWWYGLYPFIERYILDNWVGLSYLSLIIISSWLNIFWLSSLSSWMGFRLHSSVWIMDDVGVSNLICIFPLIMSLCTRNVVGGRVSLWILRGYGSWVGLITITWSHPFVSALFKKSVSKLREDLLFWDRDFVGVWHNNKNTWLDLTYTGSPLIVLFLGPRKNRTNGNPYY